MDENDQKMKERMDVQDNKIDAVVSMVHKQTETADQIKAMPKTLFTRFSMFFFAYLLYCFVWL